MILRTAARELRAHPLRTALGAAGVAVATAMLLDMLMLSGGLRQSFSELLAARGYGLRVTARGTLPLDADASLPGGEALLRSLGSEPGVAGVAPVLAANVFAAGAADPVRVFALGVDPEEQGVYRILRGRPPARRDEVALGRETAEALALGPGDPVRLAPGSALLGAGSGGRRFRVSGIAEFLYTAAGERPVALPREPLAELTGRPGELTFLMVRGAEGTDIEALARRLEETRPAVEVVSVGELVRRAEQRLSYFRQLALILGTVSLVVAGLLVGTLSAVSVSERLGTIAALRAIGISRRTILLSLVAETVILVAVAAVVGVAVGLGVARWLESVLAAFPGLPRAVRFFVLLPREVALALLALLLTGTVASVIPAWRAATLPIAPVLHREEP